MKTIDKYLFQAMDSYPYCLEGTIESLDYALSYNDKNTMTHCLYGRLFTEQLLNYDEAKQHFQQALAIDINAVEVYPFYLDTLILNQDFDEAEKLIVFALKVKGINKAEILLKKVWLLEKLGKFKKAQKGIREVKLESTDQNLQCDIEAMENRIKNKLEMLSGKKSNRKSKKSKKKSK